MADLDTGRRHEPSPQQDKVYIPLIAHEADLTLNEVITGEELLRLPRASGRLFASAGRLVTHGENLSLRVWDTDARPVREILSAKSDFHVDGCDLQGRALAILDWSGILTEYLLDGSGAVTELARPGSGIAYWCPGGGRLVLQSHSSSLRALDTTLPRDNVVTRHASYAYDVAVNPSLGLVATAGWDGYASQPGGLRLLDLDSGAELLRLGNDSWIGQWVSWLPGTGDLVVNGIVRREGGFDGATVRRIDVVRGEVLWEVGQGRVQGSLAVPTARASRSRGTTVSWPFSTRPMAARSAPEPDEQHRASGVLGRTATPPPTPPARPTTGSPSCSPSARVEDAMLRSNMAAQPNGKGEPRELIEAALRLPPEARAALAGALIDSLDETIDEGAEALWVEEIERRQRELDQGRVRAIPWSQARRAIQGG